MKPINELLNDKSRFNSILNLLPEKFVEDWVNYLWNANYPTGYTEAIRLYDDYRKKIMSEFTDLKTNAQYKKLNEAFADLKSFLDLHFNVPQEHYKTYKNPPFYYLEPRVHHNFRLDEGRQNSQSSEKQDSREWNKYKNELDKLAKTFNQSYKNFITAAKKKIEMAALPKSPMKKIGLISQKISFDDTKPSIIIGDKECGLPPYKNEHYFCRAIFQYPAKEFVDWSIIFESMDKVLNSVTTKDSRRDKRMVQDTMYAINKRIKEIINTDDELFSWKEKSITRNY